MPNKGEVGFADYVLYDDAHRPLAVIEAKRTCVDPARGRQQAKLYADLLEKQCGRRPVIFLTNGFDTRHGRRHLSRAPGGRHLLQAGPGKTLQSAHHAHQPGQHPGGPQHRRALLSGGRHQGRLPGLWPQNRRKALLVMATGSGKTRTVIALVQCAAAAMAG